MYHQFNIQQFYVLSTLCICVFCVDLRTKSHYFPIQHQLTGFYNRDGKCLLRGTDWIFKHNSSWSSSLNGLPRIRWPVAVLPLRRIRWPVAVLPLRRIRWLVAVLPLRRIRLDSMSIHLGFVAEQVTRGQVYLLMLLLSPVSAIPNALY